MYYKLVNVLNEFLLPRYGDDLFFHFENPVKEDQEIKLKRYESGLKYGWLNVNEVRESEGYDLIKELDNVKSKREFMCKPFKRTSKEKIRDNIESEILRNN